MTTETVVGIDVAKASFDVALPLGQPGKFRTRAKIGNHAAGFAELLQWLDQHAPEAALCMEATGTYHEALATFLVAHGRTVYVVNPAQIAYFAKSELSRTKTDRTDAKVIAVFATSRRPLKPLRPWTPPTPAQRTLRALVYRLEQVQSMRQMEANRLDTAEPTVHASLAEHLVALDQQIATLRKAIHDHIDSDPDLKRDRDLLQSIPGIAQTTSAWLLACLGDMRRFSHPGQLVAYAGLNPAIRQSGVWKGHTRISKIGHATLRAKLYMPALVARKYAPHIHAFCQRLQAAGKVPKVIICAAMRKLLHIAWGVVTSGVPYDPEYAVA